MQDPEVQDDVAQTDWLAAGEVTTKALTQKRFPCGQCGAVLHYAIGTDFLACQYCGHENQIQMAAEPIRELDLHTALRQLQTSKPKTADTKAIVCPNCAATFNLDAHIHSGECPFCASTVVVETGDANPIKPKALLPFEIDSQEAVAAYKTWLGKRWFAPNKLKQYAKEEAGLHGVYIPYWTYDSDTTSSYSGQRGDVYYVRQRYTTVVDGRRVTRTRQVPKVRWTPVSGRTSRHFDDVLVGATRTLPRKITDWLEPWDLENLVPYTEDYLSGFSSEVYQVELDQGFSLAQKRMDKIIRSDVRHAIGGDQQRISRLKTNHSDTTFKHVLLPVWTAAFRFRGKTYRFVVNGRTGKVHGERPWSVVKIAAAAITGGALTVGGGAYVAENSEFSSSTGGPLDQIFDRSSRHQFDWGSEPSPTRWPGSGSSTNRQWDEESDLRRIFEF